MPALRQLSLHPPQVAIAQAKAGGEHALVRNRLLCFAEHGGALKEGGMFGEKA